MKILLLFLFLIANISLAQQRYIGQINDPDGYTNIRKAPNSKAEIIGKLLKNEYFFYTENPSSWYEVSTQRKVQGFVHKSRVQKVNDKELIALKIDFEDNTIEAENQTMQDTIVKLNSLKDILPFNLIGYNYPKIPHKVTEGNELWISNKDIKLEFVTKKVNKSDYKFKINKNGQTIVGKGESVWGYFYLEDYPKKEISYIRITFAGKEPYLLSKTKYLFNPTLSSVRVYDRANGQYMIDFEGGDGAEGYNALFVFDEKGLIKRYLYRNF
ncbi:SH3 domain-containing protein [Capnocytophaga leadbetteri]|uniref:SH3 domain-containing protein n=1 Tax=Capnocytophaga leadbetteri TaxID=327575 RepID=UPI0026EA1B1D|nr:SH3 domain-containing protein [Capnocytophaga leadbetteri]